MTKPDDADRPPRTLAGALVLSVAFVLGMFALGMLVATAEVLSDRAAPEFAVYLGGAIALSILALASWLVYRNRRVLSLPSSPRQREAGLMLYLSAGVGLAVVIALIWLVGADFGTKVIFSDEPLSLATVLILAGAFAIGIVLSIRWMVLLDEHERAAHDFGAVVAFYLYLTVSAIWWLLARGGLAPWPNGILIFWLAFAAWVAGWAWRRGS